MVASVATVVGSAEREWVHWGKSTWNLVTGHRALGHTDDETSFAQYVVDQYCAVGGGKPTLSAISDDRYFWSAVGMSAIMKGGGFAATEFPFAQTHSRWIRRFIAARRSNEGAAAYWGFRQGEVGGEPHVGDLVAYARGTGMTAAKAAKLFNSKSSYQSHSDIVVARRQGEIDVIGANVLDSVTRKTLALDVSGHIQDHEHHWFAVLRKRGP